MAGEGQPKYRHIAADLRARIETGEYPPGSQLPSKAQLMNGYSAALGTVDKAIGVLRDLGFAETRHGLGTYVCNPLPAMPADDAVMKRIDEIGEEVRQLREEVDALKRRTASPDA